MRSSRRRCPGHLLLPCVGSEVFLIPGGKNTPRAWPRSSVAPLAHVVMALVPPRTSMVLLSSICYCSFGEVFDSRRTKKHPACFVQTACRTRPAWSWACVVPCVVYRPRILTWSHVSIPGGKVYPACFVMCVCPANRLWSDTQFVKCTQMGAGIILKFQAEKFTRRAVPCAFAPRTAFGRIVHLFIVCRWLLENFKIPGGEIYQACYVRLPREPLLVGYSIYCLCADGFWGNFKIPGGKNYPAGFVIERAQRNLSQQFQNLDAKSLRHENRPTRIVK